MSVLADESRAETQRTLSDFLTSKGPAASFVSAMEKGVIELPSEDQVQLALDVIGTDPKALPRVLELVRGVADERTEGRPRRAVLVFGAEVIRSLDATLAEWGTRGTISSETEVGELARYLKKARSSNDKARVAVAEVLLQIGVVVASTRADFDVLATTNILASNLYAKRPEPVSARKKIQKAIRRASVKTLETYASLSTAIGGRLQEVSAQLAAQVELTQRAQERHRDAQARLVDHDKTIAELRSEVARLRQEVEHARGRLAGVKGGAADDMIKLRARTRQFYALKIRDVLETAESALAIDPPSVRVALERIHDVLSDVRKELAWIDQS